MTTTSQYAIRSWPNEGIPLQKDKTLYDLLEITTNPYDKYKQGTVSVRGTYEITGTEVIEFVDYDAKLGNNLNRLRNNVHINSARDVSLDKFGELVNLPRKQGETDVEYRTRIKTTFRASTTGTTINETIEFIANILQTDTEYVTLKRQTTSEPVLTLTVDNSALERLSVTTETFVGLVNQVIPSSHRIDVIGRGTLTVRGAAQENDASKGLVSPGESGGGTLSSGALDGVE